MQGQTYFSKSELLKCNSHLNLISLSRSQAIPVITYSPSKFDLQFSIFGSCDFQGLRHTDVHVSEFFFYLKRFFGIQGFPKNVSNLFLETANQDPQRILSVLKLKTQAPKLQLSNCVQVFQETENQVLNLDCQLLSTWVVFVQVIQKF